MPFIKLSTINLRRTSSNANSALSAIPASRTARTSSHTQWQFVLPCPRLRLDELLIFLLLIGFKDDCMKSRLVATKCPQDSMDRKIAATPNAGPRVDQFILREC